VVSGVELDHISGTKDGSKSCVFMTRSPSGGQCS
jgi:hypothetical protein